MSRLAGLRITTNDLMPPGRCALKLGGRIIGIGPIANVSPDAKADEVIVHPSFFDSLRAALSPEAPASTKEEGDGR